ncbi:MAG: hypothetical protein FWG91_08740 [Lachnospiraceae bacterium]|nr:hypothetical protein [Lachnospiraceae bacterium]
MKNKIAISLCLILFTSLFGACQAANGTSETAGTTAPVNEASAVQAEQQVESSFTVTFYDGDAVLATEEVGSGELVTEFLPEKDGSNFVGWFSTPSKNHYFNFENLITEDTSVFAGFSFFEEDTREFFIVGSGKSSLLVQSGWGATVTDEMKLTKAEGKNEYTITTDLLKGDQFQFAINGKWENQRGFGYLTEKDLPDGTAAFSGDGGFGDASAKNKNITVELDGNYTLTLTTFPADDSYDEGREGFSEETKENYNQGTFDTITWVRNGDVEVVVETETTYYIKGETITGWDDVYDDSTRMQNENGKHILTVNLLEGEPFLFTSMVKSGDSEAVGSEYLKFHFLDEAGQNLFAPQNAANPDDSNLVALAAGTYTFVYDAAAQILTATID